MHISIAALGTHGDVQPMVALGKGLKAAGHSVQLIAGQNFVEWIKENGLDCLGTVDMQALMRGEDGVTMSETGQNMIKLMRTMRRLMIENRDKMLEPLQYAAQHSDLMLGGFGSDALVQTFNEKYGVRHISVPLQPFRPTRSGTAMIQPIIRNGDSVLNLWLGGFVESMVWMLSGETTNYLRKKLGLKPHTARSYNRIAHTTPTVYGFSHHIVPSAVDWPDYVKVAGFWFLDHPADYQPPAALAEFLAAGPAPIYVGFGSMSNRDPEATFKIVAEALARTGQRGIVGKGWGGTKAEALPDHIFALESVPHTWLFPRMAAVVHHGGAGTSAAGLQAGVPSLLIPHSVDQPYWARRLHDLGVSPKPIQRPKLTVDSLTQGIQALISDNTIRDCAIRTGELIRAERGVENAVEWIEHFSKV